MNIRDAINKALIGVIAYVLGVVESVYALLQVFSGNVNYYELNTLIKQSLGIVGIGVKDLGQALVLGPMVMSGYLAWLIIALIILSNALIAVFTYRVGRLRGLAGGVLSMVVIAALTNAQLLSLTLNPWRPEFLATALAVAMYYYVSTDEAVVSVGLAALMALLSPGTAILDILIPITHWLSTRRFNDSDWYVATIGLIAFTYYMISNAYQVTGAITAQGIINSVIYSLATTSFIQVVSPATAIPALTSAVLGSVGLQVVVPAVLVITLVEAMARVREARLAALVLGVSVLMAILVSPASPLWPPYQGTGGIGMNWSPLNSNATTIYSLVNLAPTGRIETPLWASTASLMLKPGRQVLGEAMPVGPAAGTYAICGDYQLVIRNYSGVTIINDFSEVIKNLVTNSTSYTYSDEGLTIIGGTYQRVFLVSTGILEIPPGTYKIATDLDVSPVKAYMNASAPITLTTPLTGTVLPVSAYSVITFNLNLNFTGTILQVVIYGVSYSEEPANLALTILRNGQVVGRATATAPPITQGLKPHPIGFNIEVNVAPGTYEVSIVADQPMIIYVAPGTGMNITNTQYPGEVPTYAIIALALTKRPEKFTWLTASLITADEEVGMNITSPGTYIVEEEAQFKNWTRTSIELVLTSGTPVLTANVTVGPITIEPLEPSKCPEPILVELFTEPGHAILTMLTALPIAAALPLAPRVRVNERVRRYVVALGVALMLLFYIAWALGFTGVTPQLYNQTILRALGILFIVGLVLTIATALMTTQKPREEGKRY